MRRTPLRPLADVINTREQGQDPNIIEARERAKRNRKLANKHRVRAENRLLILGLCFVLGFGAIGGKMAILATTTPAEPRHSVVGTEILNQRADILDRRGNILATNLSTQALYAQPPFMVDPEKAAKDLMKIFPDLNYKRLHRDFTSGKRKFLWIKKNISPEQRQLVHDLGEPGLLFGNREMRLYPNGRLASHILGGTRFGEEGVHAAEVVGVAGVEKYFDEILRDPALKGAPLELSIDITAQNAMRSVLADGMTYMNAKGASAILMDVHTGEIRAMVSLPDFDPNNRPNPATSGDPSDSPLFNRAAQGLYELGSTFKVFTVASALEKGLANPNTMIETTKFKWGKYPIKDYKDYGKELSVADIIMKSSNTGTARLALSAGVKTQKEILGDLGFFQASPVELSEASRTKPLLPKDWSDISTITISYGHGISATPLHLATAYSILANGGYHITPTLLNLDFTEAKGEQVISEKTSKSLMSMMRRVVANEDGTATMADVAGYEVAGKTGTAEKPKKTGGYDKEKVIATFAGVFPASAPKYTLVISLDEPSIQAFGEKRRSAGWTAVPVANELITRLAPIMNLRPIEQPSEQEYMPVKQQ